MTVRMRWLALVAMTACASEPERLVADPGMLHFVSAGESTAVALTALDGRGRPVAVESCTFASSDPAVAAVDRRGTVTARDSGTAKLVVSCGALTTSVPIEVELPTTIAIAALCEQVHGCVRVSEDPVSLKLEGLGARARIKARVLGPDGKPIDGVQPRFEAADPGLDADRRKIGIALAPDGEVRAVGGGHFLVLVHGGTLMGQVNVEVALPQVDVVKAPAELHLRVGEQAALKAKTYRRVRRHQLQPVSGAMLGYTSSAPNVVAVDANGVLRAVSPGRAQVIVAADTGAFAQVSVAVVGGRGRAR